MLTPTGAFKFITLGPAPSKTLLVLQVFAQVLNILKQIPVPSFTVLPANSFSPNLVKYSMCAYFLNFYAGKKKYFYAASPDRCASSRDFVFVPFI